MNFESKPNIHLPIAEQKGQHVRLELLQPQHMEQLLAFELPEEQLRFTALPMEVLEISIRDPERHPVVVTADGHAVGFFVLHEGAGVATYRSYTSTAPEQLMLLRALLIDHKQQGHGFARLAMQALRPFVHLHFPPIREIVLAVNIRNEPAQQLYLRTGFEDRGMRRPGALGLQWIMHYQV
ncbi:GNAT family N-acetyltransferase [Paenibacillus campi]|uniref:GNAT family N-acetyltransferase n=1 Tax=Paenibacillus campi TaxID=3106031 RepID=UPI002AFEFE70|nr:GNAT family N-acetyltransferase [Paenibacillus sp. SGZ-1014]